MSKTYLPGLYRVYSTPGVGDFHDREEGITHYFEWERDEEAEYGEAIGNAARAVLEGPEGMTGDEILKWVGFSEESAGHPCPNDPILNTLRAIAAVLKEQEERK